ncbi:MAG: hypothetical protein KC431_24730, partial [Myxococcales bacterium]|nr:hypothetical protein [Myxococcales bacterium]
MRRLSISLICLASCGGSGSRGDTTLDAVDSIGVTGEEDSTGSGESSESTTTSDDGTTSSTSSTSSDSSSESTTTTDSESSSESTTTGEPGASLGIFDL